MDWLYVWLKDDALSLVLLGVFITTAIHLNMTLNDAEYLPSVYPEKCFNRLNLSDM